ncbi:MAG: threonine/serine dehydratase [Cyclobacteriaceae bacterium]|nr:threonine/serine dehydratase [Cyclobacteriaceae bacterium]
MQIPSLSDIKRAHQRISKYLETTPVMVSQSIDEISGANVFFKCENFQKTGSFKLRGATNAIFSIRPEERTNGFATHSSGNHAQAVAYAARLAGTKAYIVMPNNAPEVKKKAVKGYGGEIVFCEPNEEARVKTCDELIAKTGAIFISPFHHTDIIAGQATAAKELIEEVNDLDVIMTPVGGGGLAAGTALAVNYLSPNIRVVLGEPKNADDTYQSFKKGSILPVNNPDTIADGLKVTVGELNFEIIQKHVSDVVTVTEKEIITAMRHIWERMKIVVEPSTAVPFAALLKRKAEFEGKKVGIILTGGNVDLGNLPFQ